MPGLHGDGQPAYLYVPQPAHHLLNLSQAGRLFKETVHISILQNFIISSNTVVMDHESELCLNSVRK